MADERHDKDQNQKPQENLENVEVEELDDKGLEEASGGLEDQEAEGILNWNCHC
jgi:hypothetical protein